MVAQVRSSNLRLLLVLEEGMHGLMSSRDFTALELVTDLRLDLTIINITYFGIVPRSIWRHEVLAFVVAVEDQVLDLWSIGMLLSVKRLWRLRRLFCADLDVRIRFVVVRHLEATLLLKVHLMAQILVFQRVLYLRLACGIRAVLSALQIKLLLAEDLRCFYGLDRLLADLHWLKLEVAVCNGVELFERLAD